MARASKLPHTPAGASATVLLLPGMTLNTTIFPPLPHATVAVDFTRWVPEPAAGPGGSRLDRYVAELDARLDTPIWRRAGRRLVVAHSFGGMVALAWWLAHGGAGPARIDGLVLAGTTAGPMYRVVRAAIPGVGRLPVAPMMALWDAPLVTRGVDFLLSAGRTRAVDFASLRHRGDVAVGLAGWRATDWRARRAMRAAMRGFDVRARLGDIPVPSIVLHGDRDRLFPLSVAEDLAGGLPRATLRVVPGGGHMLPLTHGDLVRAAVRDLS